MTGVRIGRVLAPVLVVVVLLGAWLLLVELGWAPRTLLPSPGEAGEELVAQLGTIALNALVTGTNALLGLLIGGLLAVLFGALGARVTPLGGAFAPAIVAVAVVPIVALTPILTAALGVSAQTGRILLAALVAFVPVGIGLLRGLRVARPVQRDLFRAMAASGGQTSQKLTFPSALPHLLRGVRVAATLAVVAATAAELLGGPADGLGAAIATHAAAGSTALAWACCGAVLGLGLVLLLVTLPLERVAAARFPARS